MRLLLVIILSSFLLISCSSTPLIPNLNNDVSESRISPDKALTLGIFQISIEPVSGGYEVSQLRQAASTDVLEVVDITHFLSSLPCTDCVKIRSVGLDADLRVAVEIGIRHPFEPGDPLFPPTGKNRADLHVFNVEGIVVSSGDAMEFPGIKESIATNRLLNADGYTGYLDDSLDAIFPTNATVHPYIMHFDDYTDGNYSTSNMYGFASVTDPGPSGKLVMPMGSDYDYKSYIFELTDDSLEFIYAVGCTYALAAETVTQRFFPLYRIPQHNKKAASEISYSVISSSLQAFDTSSEAKVHFKVVDVSHGIQTGGNLDDMLADSSVSDLYIEIPGLMSNVIHVNGADKLSGSGHDPNDPLIYEVVIQNELAADLGSYPGLIKVVDSYPPNLNQNIGLNQMDGISRVEPGTTPLGGLFDIQEFATYQHFELTVGEIIELPIWSTVSGDIANTGRIGYNGPQSIHNAPTWTGVYPPGWNFYGNPIPVFYNETTLFVCTTGDGGPLPAYAIDIATKELKWSQQFHDDMQNWLNIKCLNSDGTVVLCVETKYDRMVGLDAETGDFMWEVPGIMKVDSFPTLDLDGNFICPVEDVGIVSIEPVSGSVNWTANIGDTYYNTPATGANGVIYTIDGGQWDGNLKAIDPSDGSVKWETESIGLLRGMAVTVHPNQTILAWGGDGLFCFQDDGDSHTALWSEPYACPFYGGLAIGEDDDIFALDYDKVLRRIDPSDGSTITSTGGWGYGNSSRLAIGADGLIYTRTYLYDENEAYMSCFNPDCTLRWNHMAGQWFVGDGHYAAPAIGMDGSLYSCYRPWGVCGWHDDDL